MMSDIPVVHMNWLDFKQGCFQFCPPPQKKCESVNMFYSGVHTHTPLSPCVCAPSHSQVDRQPAQFTHIRNKTGCVMWCENEMFFEESMDCQVPSVSKSSLQSRLRSLFCLCTEEHSWIQWHTKVNDFYIYSMVQTSCGGHVLLLSVPNLSPTTLKPKLRI